MMERILKLAEQARQYAWENETHWSADAERERLFEQKFAELIVKECGVALSPMLRDMVSRGQAFDLIKKHFGVDV